MSARKSLEGLFLEVFTAAKWTRGSNILQPRGLRDIIAPRPTPSILWLKVSLGGIAL